MGYGKGVRQHERTRLEKLMCAFMDTVAVQSPLMNKSSAINGWHSNLNLLSFFLPAYLLHVKHMVSLFLSICIQYCLLLGNSYRVFVEELEYQKGTKLRKQRFFCFWIISERPYYSMMQWRRNTVLSSGISTFHETFNYYYFILFSLPIVYRYCPPGYLYLKHIGCIR